MSFFKRWMIRTDPFSSGYICNLRSYNLFKFANVFLVNQICHILGFFFYVLVTWAHRSISQRKMDRFGSSIFWRNSFRVIFFFWFSTICWIEKVDNKRSGFCLNHFFKKRKIKFRKKGNCDWSIKELTLIMEATAWTSLASRFGIEFCDKTFSILSLISSVPATLKINSVFVLYF